MCLGKPTWRLNFPQSVVNVKSFCTVTLCYHVSVSWHLMNHSAFILRVLGEIFGLFDCWTWTWSLSICWKLTSIQILLKRVLILADFCLSACCNSDAYVLQGEVIVVTISSNFLLSVSSLISHFSRMEVVYKSDLCQAVTVYGPY
jgi:hypothetical protein